MMGPGWSPTGRAPSRPNEQSLNPALERMREAGALDGCGPGGSVTSKTVSGALTELSNIAAEALTLLDELNDENYFAFDQRCRVSALRARLEKACRSAS